MSKNTTAFQISEEFREAFISEQQSPEKNLVAALIGRALVDWIGPAHVEQHLRRQARAWLFSKTNKVYGCNWCLKELGLFECKDRLLKSVKENGFNY